MDDYLYYLMSLILPPEETGPGSPALFLFRALNEVPFIAYNEMDKNRVADAIDIRDGWSAEMQDRPVTLLEIVVELSLYLASARENMMASPEPGRWFMEILGNAGISMRTPREKIIEIGKRIVRRELGLFPLDRTDGDAKQMELWMQLNRYLVERYHA